MEIDETWLAINNKHVDNSTAKHQLVPVHRVLSPVEANEVCEEYNVDKADLPFIDGSDPALNGLTSVDGDVIEVVRDSRTTDIARSYRLVVSDDSDLGEEWSYEPTVPDRMYDGRTDWDSGVSKHILTNLTASVPPTEVGACRHIAVNREAEIETAKSRALRPKRYTFIEGELGFGKSFFLHWLRDEVAPLAAVSIIDVGETINFNHLPSIVINFRNGLHTPRSIENDGYANGLDELWDTYVSRIVSGTISYLRDRGFELCTDRVRPNILSAIDHGISSFDISDEFKDELVELARSYVTSDTKYRSFSAVFPDDEITEDNVGDVLTLMAELSSAAGLPLVLAIDELEKSVRTKTHFENIYEFVSDLPDNVAFFVTGTPELLDGSGSDVGMAGTFEPLYELSTQNQISLESPTTEDLTTFTEQLLAVETEVDGRTELSDLVANFGGVSETVSEFVSQKEARTLTFREYVEYLQQ